MKVQIGAAAIILCCALLFFAGCTETPDNDIGIGEITIYNIPAKINEGEDAAYTNAYKVYINASNSDEKTVLHEAQGTALLTAGAGAEFADEVTIPLYKPFSTDPTKKADPDEHGGPWHGEAVYFSVVISPKKTKESANAIWVKAGGPLNKGKARLNWNSLINFRDQVKDPLEPGKYFDDRQKALYEDIVCRDTNDIVILHHDNF